MRIVGVLLSSLIISVNTFANLPIKSTGLKTFKGEKLSTINSGKKGTVLFFLSSTCPCSNSHVKHFKELAKEFKDFSFVGVHSDKDADLTKAKKYFLDKNLPFPILEDSKQVIANELEAMKTPHTFVFNNNKKIVFHGGVTNSSSLDNASKFYLLNALTNINQGKAPTKKFARALGCYIGR